MARIRSIKPEFFTDRTMGRLGLAAAVVYQALWCWADDGGVAQCDADRLKAQTFAFWNELPEDAIRAALDLLESSGRITRYSVGEDTYCEIHKFLQHQHINNPSKVRYPRLSPSPTVALPLGKGKGKGKGVGGEREREDSAAPDGATLADAHPRLAQFTALRSKP